MTLSRARDLFLVAAATGLVNSAAGAQVETDAVQIQLAMARYVSERPIGAEVRQAGARFVATPYQLRERWGTTRSSAHADTVTRQLGLEPARENPAVLPCERSDRTTPCGIAGDKSLLTMSLPAIKGDSATIETHFWLWTSPTTRPSVRNPDYPDSFSTYLVLRDKESGWRVDRLIRSGMK
jgi:hypothetical protein